MVEHVVGSHIAQFISRDSNGKKIKNNMKHNLYFPIEICYIKRHIPKKIEFSLIVQY